MFLFGRKKHRSGETSSTSQLSSGQTSSSSKGKDSSDMRLRSKQRKHKTDKKKSTTKGVTTTSSNKKQVKQQQPKKKYFFGPGNSDSGPTQNNHKSTKPDRGSSYNPTSTSNKYDYYNDQRYWQQQQQRSHHHGQYLEYQYDEARGEQQPEEYYNDNSSLDMSLYTTQSKATLEYRDHSMMRMDSTIASASCYTTTTKYYDMHREFALMKARQASGAAGAGPTSTSTATKVAKSSKPVNGTILSPPPHPAERKEKKSATVSTKANLVKRNGKENESPFLAVSTMNVIERLRDSVPNQLLTPSTRSESTGGSSPPSSPPFDNGRRDEPPLTLKDRKASSSTISSPTLGISPMSSPERERKSSTSNIHLSPPSSPEAVIRSFSSYASNPLKDEYLHRKSKQQPEKQRMVVRPASPCQDTCDSNSQYEYTGPVDLDEEIDFGAIKLPNEMENDAALTPGALSQFDDEISAQTPISVSTHNIEEPSPLLIPIQQQEEEVDHSVNLDQSVDNSDTSYQYSFASSALPSVVPRNPFKEFSSPSPPQQSRPHSPEQISEAPLEFVESPGSSYLIWTDDENENYQRGSVRTDDDESSRAIDVNEVLSEISMPMDSQEQYKRFQQQSPSKVAISSVYTPTFQPSEDISFFNRANDKKEELSAHQRDLRDESSQASSKGAVLLTEGELKKHMKKTLLSEDKHTSSGVLPGFEAWRHEQEMERKEFARMQIQQKKDLAKKREELGKQANYYDGRSGPNRQQTPPEKSRRWPRPFRRTAPTGKGQQDKKNHGRNESKPVVPLGKFMEIVKHAQLREDTGDFSLAPLNTMENPIHLGDTLPDVRASSKKTSRGKHKASTKQRALQHLHEEREKQRLARAEQEREEKEESKRIALLRERELQRQREREAQPRSAVPTARRHVRSDSSDDGLGRRLHGMVDRSTRGAANASSGIPFPGSHSIASSTKPCSDLSSSNSSLALCVKCNTGERTHIAMPCMHFCFCEGCVKQLSESYGNDSVCPVCHTKDVVFTRVKLG